ncbi:hypothetical protein Droror1_Dr00024197 [Drosera rotundifolia]
MWMVMVKAVGEWEEERDVIVARLSSSRRRRRAPLRHTPTPSVRTASATLCPPRSPPPPPRAATTVLDFWLQGDQRKNVATFLVQAGIVKKDNIKIHGF